LVDNRYAARVLPDRRHFGIEADQIIDLADEGAGDHVHAADRLKQCRLESIVGADKKALPHTGLEKIAQAERLRGSRRAGSAAARSLVIAAFLAAHEVRRVGVVRIERPPTAQGSQENFLILARDGLVELALARCLGKQLCDIAIEIGLDLAIALRFAVEGAPRMEPSVVVHLNERLERDVEASAIVEHAVVMVRNAPWTGIEIES